MANITGNAPAPVISAPGPFPVGIPENEGFWSRHVLSGSSDGAVLEVPC